MRKHFEFQRPKVKAVQYLIKAETYKSGRKQE